MESRAKLLGHPVHQMLIPFPIGAFALSVAFDGLHGLTNNPEHARAARSTLGVGLVTAALVIPFGFIDWRAITPGTRAKKIGVLHAVGNAAMLALFGASRVHRSHDRPSSSAKLLSLTAFLLSGATAWLGGELVSRHGIGVRNDASME
jgi:uncharacterized membrane protein